MKPNWNIPPRHRVWLCCGLVLMGLLASLAAAGEVQSGDITLRYNALTTAALPPAAAAQYGLTRDAGQALLVIVAARAGHNLVINGHGTAATLLGQAIPLQIRAVSDASGASLLVSFKLTDSGTVRFDLTVTTSDGVAIPLRFTQDFVVD